MKPVITPAQADRIAHEGLDRHGLVGERTHQEWDEHWTAHPEMYAALYAVVIKGRNPAEVCHVLDAHYSPRPDVADWVLGEAHAAKRRRAS